MNINKIFILYFFLFFNIVFANTQIDLTEEEKQWISNKKTVTYSEVNWKPLSIIENNSMQGILGDYLEIISNKTGIEFKYVESSTWKEVLTKFKNKEIDLVPGIGTSKKENALGLVSKTYSSYPMAIVTTDKYKYINDLDDLSNKTLAIPKYYTSYNFVKQKFPNINIIETKDITEALFFVEEGKADAFVGHIATSLYYIAQNYLTNLKISGTTSFKFNHSYLVQKEDKVLVSILNKAINTITYKEKKEIYSKWIQPTIIKKRVDYTVLYVVLVVSIFIIALLIYRHRILKQANDDMAGILNAAIEGIVVSKNQRCIHINDSGVKILGFPKEELLGKSILEMIVEEDRQKVIDGLKDESPRPYEVRAFVASGKTIPVLIKGTNTVINNEKVRLSSFVDLSETKQKEAILFQQSKMAAMGEMLGNIAHQWRQPLSTISVAATGLKVQKEMGALTDNNLIESLDAINDSSQYLSKTIDDFRNFFSPAQKEYEYIKVESIINDSLKIIESQFTSLEIQIVKNIEDFEVYLIRNELIQVLINILNNSKDALLTKEDNRVIVINAFSKEGSLNINIQDNAGGVEQKILSRIFEPYFTTKHKSQGTGIGLYMTEEIISKHFFGKIRAYNKEFDFEDKKEFGACFSIKIPSCVK